MRVTALLHGFGERERSADVPDGTTVEAFVRALGIEPETVLVFRGNDPLPSDELLVEGERVRVLRIVSGG